MSGPDLCKHGNPISDVDWPHLKPCPECAREFCEWVRRGEEPCPICGDTVRRLREALAVEAEVVDALADALPVDLEDVLDADLCERWEQALADAGVEDDEQG